MDKLTKVVSMEYIIIRTLWLHENHEKRNHRDHIVNLSTLLMLTYTSFSPFFPCSMLTHIHISNLSATIFTSLPLFSAFPFWPVLLSPPLGCYISFFLVVGSNFYVSVS
jgi:hypothetical protein